jgi:arginase family enzyme
MIHKYVNSFDYTYISDDKPFELHQMGNYISVFQDEMYDFSEYQIAILGVKESRNADHGNITCDLAPEEVRKFLYRLNVARLFPKIIDLGNIIEGETPQDTMEHVETVLRYLHNQGLTVIIIGGSQDITVPQIKAMDEVSRFINLCIVDERIDIDGRSQEVLSSNYLKEVVMQKTPQVFNLHLFGYQTYYTYEHQLEQLEKMNFNYLRLGQLRYEIPKYEYIFRDCHVASIDIASVKQSDAPGRSMQSPNGFFSDELCQIARYCGLSTRLQSIGFYEFNPNFDLRNQTAQLYAQAIWYFLEGFSLRYDFSPNSEAMKDQCKNYIVAPEGFEEQPFHFWKYEDLNQWWFEAKTNKLSHYFACSYDDYVSCSQGLITDYIFKILKRI